MKDEIIEEIRRFRDAYAARFNYDLDAIFRDIKERERQSGREYVSPPPKLTPSAAGTRSLADPKSEAGSNLPVTVSRES